MAQESKTTDDSQNGRKSGLRNQSHPLPAQMQKDWSSKSAISTEVQNAWGSDDSTLRAEAHSAGNPRHRGSGIRADIIAVLGRSES
jgi:hypothetical protein